MRARSTRVTHTPPPSAICVVKFEQGPKRSREEHMAPAGRVPRVARLLALGHRIEDMIQAGELKDWADAARLVGVTRARMTQVANLLLLAPKIQESILSLSNVIYGEDPITEHTLRDVAAHADWQSQERTCPRPER